MIQSTEGLVLRTRPLTETSLIVCWLTPDFGRISTVAKGARRPKSPFQGKLDLFYLASFSFCRSPRSELHTLCEVSLRDTHSLVRKEMTCLQSACYSAELVELVTETQTPLPEIYQLMLGLIQTMEQPPADGRFLLSFELKLLSESGLGPNISELELSSRPKDLMHILANSDWAVLPALNLDKQELRLISKFLENYIAHHLGSVPRGRDQILP